MSPDLSTEYLGLRLRSPLVASAGPLTGRVETLSALQDAGVAAVVLPSLFEEEVEEDPLQLSNRLDTGVGTFAEATGDSGFFPDLEFDDLGPGVHLRLVEDAKSALEVPVIASVNARSAGAWVRYARMLADAGADAIELNLYDVVTDPAEDARRVEYRLNAAIRAVRSELSVPLAVKLSPYYSALPNLARRIAEEGADGLVLFNRFYQPDIDLDTLGVSATVSLSHPSEVRLPLRWIGILRPLLPQTSLAASSGVHTGDEVVKVLLAGADVAMMTSALLRQGPEHVAEVEAQLVTWMVEHEYTSVRQMRGSVSYRTAPDRGSYERAQYIRTLSSYLLDHALGSTHGHRG
jgi:dihydroorotate dehydrogenase (fumarate)